MEAIGLRLGTPGSPSTHGAWLVAKESAVRRGTVLGRLGTPQPEHQDRAQYRYRRERRGQDDPGDLTLHTAIVDLRRGAMRVPYRRVAVQLN